MYKVSIDNVELVNAPLGLENLTVEIIREDGFENTAQILREKTETELTFYGDGYRKIADELKVSNCPVFDVEIEKECNKVFTTLFTGKMKSSDVEVDVKKCLIQSPIRDNSFTGIVKDYLNTDLPLYYSKTKGCLPLTRVDRLVVIGLTQKLAFDVLDVLNYQIKYFTDNVSYVVSDFLTANKYIITTGYNIHNSNGALADKYPNLSFNKLFTELRKKFRLYIVVEYNSGVPYLRIEPESYSFSNVELLSIVDLPNGITEKIDISRIFNSIEVGSQDTELDTGDNFYDIYQPIDNWDKTTFTACGECSVSSNSEQNKLDLVSDFIIDSDVIYELTNLGEGVSSGNNSKIVLVNYEFSSGFDRLVRNTCNGVINTLNCTLINYNVIQNWLGYSPQCIAVSRYTQDYFYISESNVTIAFSNPDIYVVNVEGFTDITSDNNLTISPLVTQNIFVNTAPFTGTISNTFTYYKCSKDGTYNLVAEWINVRSTAPPPISVDYSLYIFIYTDDTFTAIDSQYSVTVSAANSVTDLKTLAIETGLIPITVGQCAAVCNVVELVGAAVPGTYTFTCDVINFYQKEDNSACDDLIDTTQDAKARLISFKYPLCFEDFLTIKNNKRGYISIENKKFWIKSLKYNPQKDSEFQLIGNNSIIK